MALIQSKKMPFTLFFPLGSCYNGCMEIEPVSVDIIQPQQEQSTAQSQSLSLDREAEQSAPVDTVASVQTITDPNLGQTVNILD